MPQGASPTQLNKVEHCCTPVERSIWQTLGMGVFYSLDPEYVRLSELEFTVEREYLGDNLGCFLLRGQSPQEFASHLFGDTTGNLNAKLMHNPELGITDADSLAAAIEQLIDWKALILVAAWPEAEGQLFDAQGKLVQTIRFHGSHPDEQAWRAGADGDLMGASFVRAAPWDDSGTRVVPL